MRRPFHRAPTCSRGEQCSRVGDYLLQPASIVERKNQKSVIRSARMAFSPRIGISRSKSEAVAPKKNPRGASESWHPLETENEAGLRQRNPQKRAALAVRRRRRVARQPQDVVVPDDAPRGLGRRGRQARSGRERLRVEQSDALVPACCDDQIVIGRDGADPPVSGARCEMLPSACTSASPLSACTTAAEPVCAM
jgi:hypothetical protein